MLHKLLKELLIKIIEEGNKHFDTIKECDKQMEMIIKRRNELVRMKKDKFKKILIPTDIESQISNFEILYVNNNLSIFITYRFTDREKRQYDRFSYENCVFSVHYTEKILKKASKSLSFNDKQKL